MYLFIQFANNFLSKSELHLFSFQSILIILIVDNTVIDFLVGRLEFRITLKIREKYIKLSTKYHGKVIEIPIPAVTLKLASYLHKKNTRTLISNAY